ncbi:hypothetical protein VTJ83DRAFT_2388 [Remersonia thermophila]|uniref:Meiotically up-regulated protein Msb1/Mug8 domain-containing protein n=1 Tax=Remersonia thermophila TaxID=72144 RepID=A0ABR4DIR0_9PEZI
MPSLFSRLKGKDGKKSKKNALDDLIDQQPTKPRWEDAYARKSVEPEEVQELIRLGTEELKSRGIELPFLLLPFRPTSDPSGVRTFIRHFFDGKDGAGVALRGEALAQELRMTEPMVIAGVIKWCWSRLQGGVVGWDSYELFKVGEQDSQMARDSFKTFIPLSVDSEHKSKIIFDFFDLLSAVAAHSKSNGFGGRKLSRMAAWWAFEHTDAGNGFEGGYKTWLSAADATSHLFFAYLRSLAPEPVVGGISMLPMSLQKLLQETEYPPQKPILLQTSTHRVAMIVDTVSPTPFALLRRARHFQYREEDVALKQWSEYEDPVQALTEECRRVLKAISAANQSQAVSSSKYSTGLRDASWSRFEDIGFATALEEDSLDDDSLLAQRPRQPLLPLQQQQQPQGLRSAAASATVDLGRPTTPSWADFLSSGFGADDQGTANMLLPPDKVLPPIDTGVVRQQSSQSHKPRLESDQQLEPGELASITRFDLDDAFWWVWMSSLGPEETPERKAAFGRCAVVETNIQVGRWLVMEEIVKGAAADPEEGAYIAEKKGLFSWTRRGKVNRRKSVGKHALETRGADLKSNAATIGVSKTSIGPDQQAKIQAAALQLQRQEQQKTTTQPPYERRGRKDATDYLNEKTNSVFTLQSTILSEASPAVKWAKKYDREAIREAYLADSNAGRGPGWSTTSLANGHTPSVATDKEPRPDLPPKPTPEAATTTPSAPRSETPVAPAPAPAQEDHQPEPARDRATSPVPLPKDSKKSVELARETMASPAPDASPDRKQKKLHKDQPKQSGSTGLMKIFSRKNRGSKVPDNAAEQLRAMAEADNKRSETPEPAPAQQKPVEEPKPAPPQETTTPPQEQPAPPPKAPARAAAAQKTPVASPTQATAPAPAPAPAPVARSAAASPTNVADEVPKEEFSRFNQGPLLDQPAFVPYDNDDDEDDAVPPPIARRSPRVAETPAPAAPAKNAPASAAGAAEEASAAATTTTTTTTRKPAPAPSVAARAAALAAAVQGNNNNSSNNIAARTGIPQDRWAQIRKNAAERAAQRQAAQTSPTTNPARHSNGSLLGDESSSEETIESRVARIKARVAALTANAEGLPNANGPYTGPPPPLPEEEDEDIESRVARIKGRVAALASGRQGAGPQPSSA